MEADWSAAIGADLPHIHVPWEGFVDLRTSPASTSAIEEAEDHPALQQALAALNASSSPVFTAKCDLWALTNAEIDPYEFSSTSGSAQHGFASYIDVLQRNPGRLAAFDFHETWAQSVTNRLKSLPIPDGRIDLEIRAATVDSRPGFGVTLYAAGCGADTARAYTAWQAVLTAAVAATISTGSSKQPGE